MLKHVCVLFGFLLAATSPIAVLAERQSATQRADLNNWRGEYYNNMTLSGSPALVREDSRIGFIWQGASPAPGMISSENFSVRWTRTLNLPAGWYRFHMAVDDGGRLWVNDQLVLDAWLIQSTRNRDVKLQLPGGPTLIRMEYFQATGEAVALLSWNITAPSASMPNQNWRVEYFNNTTLSGPPALVRNDAQIDINWSDGSPFTEINAASFSARWTRSLDLGSGWYRFRLTVDDGGRLWVNNQLIIDEWQVQSQQTYEASIYLSGGAANIRMEYFNNSRYAAAALSWERSNTMIRNWRGEYFNNTSLDGSPFLVRDDPEVNFSWGNGSPAPGTIHADGFSARWTRSVNLPAGKYWFAVTSDDGARLWVNDQLVIDAWHTQPPTTSGGEVYLPGGAASIRLEYFENEGTTQVQLSWAKAPDVITNWRGEYYNNSALHGAPVLVRDDAEINFDWGLNAPAPGIVQNDSFSARWTRIMNFTPGWYYFTTMSDDGSRLYVNNVLLVDAWQAQVSQKSSSDIYLSGQTSLRMEYHETSGVASALLSWEPLVALIKNWRGEYFNTMDLSDPPALVRDDRDINFNWLDASPAPFVVNPDHFSARWTRTVDLSEGWYRFTILMDDGGRLWIDNQLLIDAWKIQGPHPFEGEIYLAGGSTNIRLEYFENAGWASVQLNCQMLSQGQTSDCSFQSTP